MTISRPMTLPKTGLFWCMQVAWSGSPNGSLWSTGGLELWDGGGQLGSRTGLWPRIADALLSGINSRDTRQVWRANSCIVPGWATIACFKLTLNQSRAFFVFGICMGYGQAKHPVEVKENMEHHGYIHILQYFLFPTARDNLAVKIQNSSSTVDWFRTLSLCPPELEWN